MLARAMAFDLEPRGIISIVVNPGWGDSVQANKAGLMEIADVFVINKADLEEAGLVRLDGVAPPGVDHDDGRVGGQAGCAHGPDQTEQRRKKQ